MKKHFDDDGRVVADMNFEGAPWYVKEKKEPAGQLVGDNELMSKREMFALMKYAVGAGLAIALVFVFAFFLLILFSLKFWLN
jgi:hypothetical protein